MSIYLSRRVALMLLALLLSVNAGCALAILGAAAGAGAAGYIYYNGLLSKDFQASLADSRTAVRNALMELQFPIIKDTSDTGTVSIKTRTADGYTVWVYLDVIPSPVPAEGAVTRISVRVGFAGDERVSRQILEQVATQLRPRISTVPPSAGPPPVVNVQPPPPALTNKVGETAPPPLATTPNTKGKTN